MHSLSSLCVWDVPMLGGAECLLRTTSWHPFPSKLLCWPWSKR
jgi:hypothetical protein